MGFKQACVSRHTPTFSSEFDGRVFLCRYEDVKGEALDVQHEV